MTDIFVNYITESNKVGKILLMWGSRFMSLLHSHKTDSAVCFLIVNYVDAGIFLFEYEIHVVLAWWFASQSS